MFQFVIWKKFWWTNYWCKVCYTSWLVDEREYYWCIIVQKVCVLDIVRKSIKTVNVLFKDIERISLAIICHYSLAIIFDNIKLINTIFEPKIASSNQAIWLDLCIRRIGLKYILHGRWGLSNDKGQHLTMAHCRRSSEKTFLNKITPTIILINNHSNRRNELMVGHLRPYRQMQAFIRVSINSMHHIQKQYKQKRLQHYRM